MSVPLRMTATVSRFTSTGTDPDGNPTGSWTTAGTIACHLFHPTASAEISNDDVNVVVENPRLLVAYDADVTEQDRIAGVTMDGSTVDDRTFRITFDRRRGWPGNAIRHRALTLEAIT